MKPTPSFDDIFAVMAAASVGDAGARVEVAASADTDDTPTRLAVALNILLDDLAVAASDARQKLEERSVLAGRLQAIADASRAFAASTEDLGELLEVVARRVGELVGDLCAIRIVSDDGEWLEMGGAVYHKDPELLEVARALSVTDRQRVGEGISGQVASTGRPHILARIRPTDLAAATEPKYRAFVERLGVTSSMTLPLTCRGKVVGIANLIRGVRGEPYDEGDLRVVSSVADHAALAIANARAYAAEKVARAAAERAEEKAHASEHRYRMMFDHNPLPSWLYDVETLRFLDVNAAAVAEYGYSRDEFLVMTIKDIRLPEEVAGLLEAVYPVDLVSRSGVWSHTRKDGTSLRAEITAHGIRVGGRACRLIVANNVTDRIRLEDQLRQSQKMEAVGRLAGGIAHDFNNVLSVVLSYADMMIAGLKPGEPMRGDVEEIRRAGERAASLTRQLLMFSRQQVLEPKIIDLNEVLGSMDSMLQRILGADVDLVSLPDPSLGRVRVDPSSMEQVIMNLVVNARDAMPTGGKLTMETRNVFLDDAYVEGHVDVKRGPHIMLAVTDTGAGIETATLARIFEPFFTTKVSGKGTGLGLSTVFGIVKQSGGSVWVYSEVGQGTTFKVYLPRVDAAVDAPRPPEPPATTRGSETILLVEDDDQVRAVARGILRKNGYYVIEARNAGEALLHSEQYPGTIHLLLSDVVMPQMSGPDLAKRLARVRPDMKALCMSGYTDDSIVRHGVLEAQIAYLQKPFTPDALSSRVRTVLEGSGDERNGGRQTPTE